MQKTRPTLADALDKARKYCAYQERAHSEVRTKLLGMNIFGNDLEEILAQLVSDGFLNEERFARSFVRGKFRQNQWGRYKIVQHLKQKGVSEYCIKQGLEEINEQDYVECIDRLLERRLPEKVDFQTKRKVMDYMFRKGFEQAVVKERIEKFLATQR